MDFIIILPPPSYDATKPVRSYFIPNSALYLAESLLHNSISVSIIDEEVEETLEEVGRLLANNTIAFGISTLSGTQLKNAIIIAERLKNDYPDIPIIWGGAHINAVPRDTLESDLVDFVCIGEAELSLPTLLNAIKNNDENLDAINGIGYKKNGKCYLTDNTDFTSLDRVFNLPYHLLNVDKYARNLHHIGVKRLLSVLTSRGCPYRCKFCSNSSNLWPNTKMRYNTLDHIVNDIKTLVYKYSADAITLSDENLFANEKRLIEIFSAIKKQNFNVKYRLAGRVDRLSKLSDSTWELLKETGVIGIGTGIESGSQRILDFIGKKITLEQIYKVDELLTKYKFYKSYNFMTCIPTETMSDVRLTLKLIANLAKTSKESPFPFTQLYKYIPLPNTELFDISIQHGLKFPKDINGWKYFDLDNIKESIQIVRPWLNGDMLEYVNRSNELIERLNGYYIGKDSDYEMIDKTIEEMNLFIGNN